MYVFFNLSPRTQTYASRDPVFLSIYWSVFCMWMLYGLCWLSNLVCVISACWRYLCSSSLSSSLPHSELSVMPLLLSPSTLQSNKRDGSVGVDCCFTLLLSWQAGEEESKERRRRTEGDRRRGDEMAKRERVGGKECFVSAAAWVTERMENRTECTLCVCVHSCVYFGIQYMCCSLRTLRMLLGVCMSSWMHLHGRMWRRESTERDEQVCFDSEMEVALT